MRAVHVGVGHDDDLAIAALVDRDILVADPAVQRRDDRADLLEREHLVDPGLLDVEDLAPQRQDRLDGRVAPLLGGPAGRVALDQEQLGRLDVLGPTVRQLARQGPAGQRSLAARQVACMAGGVAGLLGLPALVEQPPGFLGVLLQPHAQLLVDRLSDERLHLGVAELGLGLPLELGFAHTDGDHRGQALAIVLAAGELVLVLEQAGVAGIGVERTRQRRAEPRKVRAALDRVDVVGEGQHRLAVAVVVLQRQSQLQPGLFVDLADHGWTAKRGLALVQVLHESDQALVVLEDVLLLRRFVLEADAEAFVEVGQLPQPGGHEVVAECAIGEDLRVGHEGDLRAGLLAMTDRLELGLSLASLELHEVNVPVAADLHLHPLTQRVDHRGPHAVQAAGDLVAVVIELAPGVELAHDHFEGRYLQRRVRPDGNANAVVDDRDRAVRVDADGDVGAPPHHGLVHGVVDQLPDQVMQAAGGGVTDVHPGPFANGLDAFEDLDLGLVIDDLALRLLLGIAAGRVLGHVHLSFPEHPMRPPCGGGRVTAEKRTT